MRPRPARSEARELGEHPDPSRLPGARASEIARAAVLRRREQTRFIVCERRRSRRIPQRDARAVKIPAYGTLWGVKAIVAREAGAPDVLELREVETPQPPSQRGLDQGRGGGRQPCRSAAATRALPAPPGVSPILGLEVSGTVAEVGAEVSNWAVDDPCVALLAGGGYAEYAPRPQVRWYHRR